LDKNAENVVAKGVSSQEQCPKIRLMKKPLLHAKAIIIDDKSAFVGSFNFTKNSLENNREAGIFIQKNSILELVNSFQEDWSKSVAFE
jgi:phosphatidylserine/phosphatidylglycerophosphate/cardiolipin synthase-like enzyme